MSANPLRTTVQSLGRTKWFGTTVRGFAPSLDRFLLKTTKGRVAILSGTGLPTLLLTTTGRKSGEPRTVPLLYVEWRGGYVVIGSNWGQEHHPAWALNLTANPAAVVQIRGTSTDVRARLLDGDERAEVWSSQLLKAWPGYQGYADRSGRDLKIYALEPVPGA
jgi:deazaflavin-dependent oxidoreductase (nitroreductase family)